MTDPVKIIVGEGDITEVNVPEYNLIQTGGGGGGGGSDGATFFPAVSQEGVISWTNDGGYDNPEPVNIKGPAGNDGNDGQNGVTFTPSVSDAGIISWTNDGDLPNPSPVNIKGASGNDGEDGDDGTTFTPAVDASGNLSWTNDGGKQNPQTVNIKGPQGDAGQGVPAGGTTGQVLAKASNADYVTEWVDQSGGGGGTSDYDDLTDKPSINGTTLSGNKTAEELGLGTYSKPSGGIPQTDLASAVQNKLDKTVAVSDTQPTEAENKLWVDTDAGAGTSYQIPTVAEMETADAQTAAEIGIVITGARPSMAVTEGQYVIVRNSTISGITDGLYTANTTLSPSADVTAANLTAVSNGGLNGLYQFVSTITVLDLANYIKTGFSFASWGGGYAHICGKLVILNVSGLRADSNLTADTPVFSGLPFDARRVVDSFYTIGATQPGTVLTRGSQVMINHVSANTDMFFTVAFLIN